MIHLNKTIAIIMVGLCTLLYTQFVSANTALPSFYSATVTKVIDGDTIRVEIPVWIGQTVTTDVRIKGIDTPELRGSCAIEKSKAKKAKARMHDLLKGQVIILEDVQYGKYAGRILAKVSLEDGTDISELMIDENLARTYGGAKRISWCG